jgi:hypothetical protein
MVTETLIRGMYRVLAEGHGVAGVSRRMRRAGAGGRRMLAVGWRNLRT